MDQNGQEAKPTHPKSHKFARLVFFVVAVFIIAGISSIAVNKYFIPYAKTSKWLNKYKFFRKATDDVVLVNKTEQVTVSEDMTIAKYSNKSASSVVEILSKQNISSKASLKSGASQPKTANVSNTKQASGLIVTADGLILTYSDGILSDPAEYQIFVSEETSYPAHVVARDSFTNLVLLKIDDVSNLPTTSFISPEDLKAGAKLVAMGRSGDNFGIVYKSGLLSQFASNFSPAGPVAISDKMQGVYFANIDFNDTGNQNLLGGTVTDYNGDVVGMLGISKNGDQVQPFIISVQYIEDLVNQFIQTGDVKRGSLGVYFLSLDRESKFSNSIDTDHGALVYSPSGQAGLAVISGGAADKAGIKLGDIIDSVNGEEVNPSQNLAYLISKYKPGDTANLKLVREGEELEVKATLQ